MRLLLLLSVVFAVGCVTPDVPRDERYRRVYDPFIRDAQGRCMQIKGTRDNAFFIVEEYHCTKR